MSPRGLFSPLIAAAAAAAIIVPSSQAAAKDMTVGTAVVIDAAGTARGRVEIVEHGDALNLRLEVHGMPAGQHGVHLHVVGSCSAPDFTSAGGHLNPHGKMHGSLNPRGSHLGDLPNLVVGRGGSGSLRARLTGTRAEVGQSLFDADGTALVVHASADDYATDPSGNSGARIACGVITRIR